MLVKSEFCFLAYPFREVMDQANVPHSSALFNMVLYFPIQLLWLPPPRPYPIEPQEVDVTHLFP